MRSYTGYLLPYRPVIAAMILAGQSNGQVTQLLMAMGVGFSPEYPNGHPSQARTSIRSQINRLNNRWTYGERPVVTHQASWTPHENWLEMMKSTGED